MKLYYDMLMFYMPDMTVGPDGNTIPDEIKGAGRRAMEELSTFQLTGNLMSLYHSVIFACKYANKDLIETITNIPEDLVVEEGVNVGYLLDESAKMLFRTINPKEIFDLNKFVAYVLTAAHLLYENYKKEQAAENDEVKNEASKEE